MLCPLGRVAPQPPPPARKSLRLAQCRARRSAPSQQITHTRRARPPHERRWRGDHTQQGGACSPYALGKCLFPAATNSECSREHGSRRIDPCKTRGWCTAKGGVCRATSDEDCKRSEVCEKTGSCVARNGECVVAAKSDADCRRGHGSLNWDHCQTSGRCSASDGTCIATKDEHCKQSQLCRESGKCTARDGKCALGVP